MTHSADPAHSLRLNELHEIVFNGVALELSGEARRRITTGRDYLEKKIATASDPIYGINTGFGALYNVSIPQTDLEQLQTNLVLSHACGAGEEVPAEIVRLMLFLKIRSLSYGHSGVRLETVLRLVDFYNADCLPVVYQQGSLGASGDLAPLAHLSLPLLGLGEVILKGRRMDAAAALEKLGLQPLTLGAKEGLALLNGTQFMLAYGLWTVMQGFALCYLSDLIGSLSLEAFDGRPEPFTPQVHLIRPHRGQIRSAEQIREFLDGSALIARKKQHVQDPYSFRCMPQVHGASWDALNYVRRVMETEMNAVTDNPNLFWEEDMVISAGNFHGQPLALALDHLALAVAELGNISERRTYQLISGSRGLPPFLSPNPGLNSGLMIPQYTAAGIVSQNKQLTVPASSDSIPSSNGQEDHVSMGANAATKAQRVVDNLWTVLGVELLTASQALRFREEATSPFLSQFVETYREEVPPLGDDRYLHPEMMRSREFLRSLSLDPELIY